MLSQLIAFFPLLSRAKLPNKAIPQAGSRLLPQLTLKLEKQNPLLPPPTHGNASFSSPQQARDMPAARITAGSQRVARVLARPPPPGLHQGV